MGMVEGCPCAATCQFDVALSSATASWREARFNRKRNSTLGSSSVSNSRGGKLRSLKFRRPAKKYGLLEGRRNPLILGRVVELLESLESSIEFNGFLDPENDRAVINRVFGEKHHCQIRNMYEVYRDNSPIAGHPEFKDFDLPRAERNAGFRECLRDEINGLKRFLKTLKRSSEVREELESQSSFVPEPARLDRLLRYGASLQRDYDRCLNQLERLQRARKGQPALPTLNVNVSA